MAETDLALLARGGAAAAGADGDGGAGGVTAGQIAALATAGAIVSLGHSEPGRGRPRAAFAAGARVVTHLFNAMSQLGNREPGLVGAALDAGAWRRG